MQNCKVTCTHGKKNQQITQSILKMSSMYCIVPNTTTAGPTTPATSPLPTTTAIQGSKKTHETLVTIHDTWITTMVTEAATQAISTNEPNISKRKNDSICLFYRIISSNYLLVSNNLCFKDFHEQPGYFCHPNTNMTSIKLEDAM